MADCGLHSSLDEEHLKRHTQPVDEHLAQLSHQVAAAADAWLTDPRDSGVYVRLVRAIEAYRHYRQPQLPTEEPEVDVSGAPVGRVDEDEVLDGLADHRAPKPLGEALGNDPAAALGRLRAP